MSAVSWRRQNIKEGMKTWQGIFTGNFAVNADWKELIAGMKRSRREWRKVHENFKILWDSTVQCDRKHRLKKGVSVSVFVTATSLKPEYPQTEL